MPRPIFTRRHYEALATWLGQSRPSIYATAEAKDQWVATVEVFTMQLEADNANFDASRFRKVCVGLLVLHNKES